MRAEFVDRGVDQLAGLGGRLGPGQVKGEVVGDDRSGDGVETLSIEDPTIDRAAAAG
jgi:hypothetical protein